MAPRVFRRWRRASPGWADDRLSPRDDHHARPPRALLGQRGHWSVRLNINNALDETQILPLRVSPKGMIVNYRFQTPREAVLTSKLAF